MAKIAADTFRRWNECIADILAVQNRARVPEMLVRACNVLLPCNDVMVSVLGANIKPALLFDDVPPDRHRKLIQSYFDGAYLLDPFYRAGVGGIESGVYRLAEVAPSGFRQSEYYKRYYGATETGDEVGIISHLPDGCFGFISLNTKAGQPDFRKIDVETLRLAGPYVHAIVAEHWDYVRASGDGAVSDLHSQLEVALSCFGESLLTGREAEVVRLYLQGHSTRSISERLDISTHTVSMHRKNAYSKLDVRSQFELFHMFIDSLVCFDPDGACDPLKAYLGLG